MEKILFSIIIPSYNGERTIGKLLERLEQLSRNYSIEVIIIDSSSTDRTRLIVNSFVGKIVNLRIIKINKSDFNHGLTRDLGVRFARGKYACFFSQDAIPYQGFDFLKLFHEDFQINKKVIAVFGKQVPYKNTPIIQKIEVQRRFYELDKYSDSKGRLIFDYDNKFIPLNEKTEVIWYSLFNTFSCYKRSFLHKNPFGKAKYGEDIIMGKKILEMKLVKVYDARAKVRHSHRFSIREYYKREKEDVKMRSTLSGLSNKTHFVSKIMIIASMNIGIFKKAFLMLQLIFYYFLKILIFLEIAVQELDFSYARRSVL